MFFFPESSHDISSSDFHHKNIFFCISALVSWASSDAWQCVVPFVEAPSLRYLKPSLGQDGTQQGSTRLAAGSGVSWWFWNKNSPTKDIPKHVGWWNIYSIYIYIPHLFVLRFHGYVWTEPHGGLSVSITIWSPWNHWGTSKAACRWRSVKLKGTLRVYRVLAQQCMSTQNTCYITFLRNPVIFSY